MTTFFLRIYDLLAANRRLCFGLLFALTAVLLGLMASLGYNENIFDFLPMDERAGKSMAVFQDVSQGDRIVVVFRMKDSTDINTDRLAEAVDTFAHRLTTGEGSDDIHELMTQADITMLTRVTDFVYDNIPVMLTEDDYAHIERCLADTAYAERQLASDVQMMLLPVAGMLGGNVECDPLALFSPVMQRLQARQAAMPFEIDNGYIYTPDCKRAIALMTTPYGALESAGNAQLAGYIDDVADATMRSLPDVDIVATGAPMIAVGNATQIKYDSILAISIAVTLILALLVFSFRSVKKLLIVSLAIPFGWMFALGGIALLHDEVSLIVLGIGSIIIGIAVNYPLHFIAHGAHGGTTREVLKDMVSPLMIGNITTVGAFACLIPLDAPALRDLGLFAAFMLVGTILFVLVFLPHLVRDEAVPQHERLTFGRLAAKSPEGHKWILAVVAVLTLFFGYFSLDTSFDANLQHISYMSPRQKEALGSMSSLIETRDTANVYVVAEGRTWDEALDLRMAQTAVLDSLKREGKVMACEDITTFICSQAEQRRRIERWEAFWETHRDGVMQLLEQRAPRHGFDVEAFAPFADIVSRQYVAHDISYFEPLTADLLRSSFSRSDSLCSAVEVLQVTQEHIADVEAAFNDRPSATAVYAFDFDGMNSSIATALSDNFNYICLVSGLIVFLFLWLSFGRLELSLLAFLPMAVGWVWILGLMQILGMQFNIINVILATFIFGQGDDYTIFMVDGLINEYAYRRKLLPSYKNSIIISALIMFVGMGSLIVARHPALFSLAEVTIVGMFTVVLMAWLLPPLIFNWIVRQGDKPRLVPVTIAGAMRTLLCRRRADAPRDSHYYHHVVLGQYLYKGFDVEIETRRLLSRCHDFSQWVDAAGDERKVAVVNSGRGQFALMFALVHPDVEVHAYAFDADDVALASCCAAKPDNLHITLCADAAKASTLAAQQKISTTYLITPDGVPEVLS